MLTPDSFELFLDQVPEESSLSGISAVIDFTLSGFLSPYAAINLLLLCEYLHAHGVSLRIEEGITPVLAACLRSWGFFSFSREYLSGQVPDPGVDTGDDKVFLKITPVHDEQDIYHIIDYVRDKLSLPREQTDDLVVVISEIAQNILEHSRARGFVNIGKGAGRLHGKETLDICIADPGIGIGASLEEKLRMYEKESLDRMALYKTLFEGISRYDDPGRGNGIIKTRGILERHRGKLMLRSGRAKLWGSVASWQIERFMRKRLRFFPGTQVSIIYPLENR